MKTKIYTDGSCWNKSVANQNDQQGDGGWACILIFPDNTKQESSGKLTNTTNNRAEMQAAIEGLKALSFRSEVELYSDSAYLVNCFRDKWYLKWQKNGWLNSKLKPVENKDLWEQLITLTEQHDVVFCKVKGHADDPLNNRCDKLAGEARKAIGI